MKIGITGSIGAGKNTVFDYLISKHGFSGGSGSEFIMARALELGLKPTRENLRNVGNSLRNEFGSYYITDKTIDSLDGKENIVVGYFRTPNEIKRFKERCAEGIILYIEAPIDVRFNRALSRGEIKDNVTKEEFIKSEELESHSSNPDEQNMLLCKKLSDIVVINTQTKEDLYNQIDDIVHRYS